MSKRGVLRTCSSTFLALPIRPAPLLEPREGPPERRRCVMQRLRPAWYAWRLLASALPPPLLQLPQHEVELVEVGELPDALVQQLQLLQDSHYVRQAEVFTP